MTTQTETAGRMETPTGRLVLSVDAPRAEWLNARRNGITATDLPAIMGLNSYRTAIDVWTDKTMPPVDDDTFSEAAYWGTKLEEPVAQAWAERHGVKIRRIGLVHNQYRPWMLASLDRIVHGCSEGKCALEVKTRSLFVSEKWATDLPEDVRAQVMWQLIVTGLSHIHVAALIGGQRLVEHTVTWDDTLAGRLIEAAGLVWAAVRANEMPDLPPELWTTDYLEQRHQTRQGATELNDQDSIVALLSYQRINEELAALEVEKAHLRTQLIGALGEADTATIAGRTAYTFREASRRTLNAKALAELYPNAANDERIYTTSTTRTLRIATNKEGTNK